MRSTYAALWIILLAALTVPSSAQRISRPDRLSKHANDAIRDGNKTIVNRVHLTLTDVGGIDESQGYGSSWINGWDINNYYAFVFDQGLFITGKRNGLLGGLPYLWYSPYARGPVINGRPALAVRPQDSSRYKVYSIIRGETADINPDIAAWPADLGAPVDAQMKPRILGDQTLWMVYNGLDTAALQSWNFVRTPSPQIVLPVEVRQTAFAHFGELRDTSVWANTVFFEWAIYNKGTDLLDSVYLTLWTDLDFLDPYSDIPGVDTLSQTGYCWYRPDSSYGAGGYTLLYGPAVQSFGDTAVFFGKQRTGYKNLPLSTFWPIRDDSYADGSNYGAPYSLKTAWNVVRGLTPSGGPIIDSLTKRPTKFPYSGDPITKRGWVSTWGTTGGGAGFMMTAGPCTIAPGDSQWIMAALHPSARLNGVDAVNRLRMNAAYLRSLPYDSLVAWKPRRSVPTNPLPEFAIPGSFQLRQNYPNPFNSSTTVPIGLPEKSRVRMDVFNVLGQCVATLADDVLERGVRSISWYPVQASGVYFVRITAASLESQQRWNATQKVVLIR